MAAVAIMPLNRADGTRGRHRLGRLAAARAAPARDDRPAPAGDRGPSSRGRTASRRRASQPTPRCVPARRRRPAIAGRRRDLERLADLRQVGQHLGGRLVAIRRILGHQLQDQPVELRRQVRAVDQHAAGDLAHLLRAPAPPAVARWNGGIAGQHVVKGDTQRVEVAAVIERMALRLLGAHVERRSHRHARLGQVRALARPGRGTGRNRRPSPGPFLVIRMFSGLTSRWISPTSPAAPIACAVCLMIEQRQRQIERPLLDDVFPQVRPLDVLHRDEVTSSISPNV